MAVQVGAGTSDTAMSAPVPAATAETIAPEPAARPVARRRRLTGIAATLTAANILGSATGFITGPLLARALGPAGRGDLAAIVVPLTLAPSLLGLGISTYAYRQLPAGRSVGDVLGSLGLPLLLIGLLAASAAVPIADEFADGRATVRAGLIVVFGLMPVLMVGNLLLTSLAALERWRRVVLGSVIPFLTALLGIVTMYAIGDLTVATAAAATIAGSVLCIAPGAPLLWEGRLRFRRSLSGAGLRFGIKSWIGGLAATANGRLDQLLMITAVPPRELGLYAVATTIAGASGLVSGALAPPLMTRIASGETYLMSQAVRMMLVSTVILNLVLASVTPLLLAVLFGPQFRDAFPMVLILLAAQVWLSGASVLSSALQADGAPLIPTIAELLALVVTIGGLFALLPPLGGIGAAIVSFAAYGTSFIVQVTIAHRRVGVALHEFLVPTRADARWARRCVADVLMKVKLAS